MPSHQSLQKTATPAQMAASPTPASPTPTSREQQATLLRPGIDTFVLAGGHSRRFGSDKALHPVQGVPNLVRIIREATSAEASLLETQYATHLALASSTASRGSIFVVAPKANSNYQADSYQKTVNQYDLVQARVIEDIMSDIGPLGGILTALSTCRTEWAWILSCDLFNWSSKWLNQLLQVTHDSQNNSTPPPQLIYFNTPTSNATNAPQPLLAKSNWYPFPALINKSLLPLVHRLVVSQHRTLASFFNHPEAFAQAAPTHHSEIPVTCNTPTELQHWLNGTPHLNDIDFGPDSVKVK